MKTVKTLAFFAAFAAIVASCQSIEPSAPQSNGIHFTIKADAPATKTVIGDNGDKTYSPAWVKGDKLGLFFKTITSSTSKADAVFSNTNESGAKANFEGTASVADGEGSFTSFYPSSAFATGFADGCAGITLPLYQNPTTTSFDPACDVLVSRPCAYMAEGGAVVIDNLQFTRPFAILKINLLGEFAKGEALQEIKLTAPEGSTLSGRAKIDLKSGNISSWSIKNNEVGATYESGSEPTIAGEHNTVYLIVAPGAFSAASKLTFSGSTASHKFSKVVTLPSDVEFLESQVSVVNLTIAEADCQAVVKETRIFVDAFDNAKTNKTQYTPAQTGATGTGVTESLSYIYGANNGVKDGNTNIRINSNGQSSSNPFLNIMVSDYFEINNIAVSNETALDFTFKAKASSNATLTVKYKVDDASTWTTISAVSVGTVWTKGESTLSFSISSSATKLCLRFDASGSSVLVDDLVLQKGVEKTKLASPANVAASLDDATVNKINVSWDAVEGAASYVVKATPAEGDATEAEVSTTSHSFTGLAYSTTYTVSVYAKPSDMKLYYNSDPASASPVTTGAKPAGASTVYAVVFKTDSSDSNTAYSKSASISTIVTSGAEYFSSCTATDKAYVGTSGLKLGSSKAAGYITFAVAENYQSNITKITVKSAKFGSDTGTLTLTVNGTAVKSGITPGTDYTHTFDAATTVTSIKIETSAKRAYISEIDLEK